MEETGIKTIDFTSSFVPFLSIKSLKSFILSLGKMKVVTPPFIPPIIFKSRPPIAVTFPCKLISPVIAIL